MDNSAKKDIFLYITRMDSGRESHENLKTAVTKYLCEKKQKTKGMTGEAWNISRDKYGKPYLTDRPEIHFSVSHSGSYWVCAVSDQPVGLDLQFRSRKGGTGNGRHSDRIAERFFHPDENMYIQNAGDFYDVWAAKESYVKYTGRGIGEGFERFAVADGEMILDRVKCRYGAGPCLKLFKKGELGHQLSEYSCCICADEIEDVLVRRL